MSHRRRVRPASRRIGAASLLTVLTALAVLAGCTIGPSNRPDLAVYGQPDATAGQTGATLPLGPGGPGQQARLVPDWQSCLDLDDPVAGAENFEVSCAGVQVPTTYSEPGAGLFGLAIARARATGLSADAPSLVVLMDNGPLEADLAGVDGLANVAAGLPSALTSRYQLIGVDIRGTGSSSAVNCWRDYPLRYLFTLDADPTGPNAADQLLTVTRAFTFGCQDYVGPETVYFDSSQAADDLDSIRSALGVPTLNILGAGYGATLGGVYADRYPGRVGRVVLDSPTDHSVPDADRAATSAVQYERALQAFLTDCASRAGCALGTTPADAVTTAITQMEYDPNLGDGAAPGSGIVLWALLAALPDRDLWPDLAAALGDAADGDRATISTFMEELVDTPAGYLSTRMMLTCNDSDERLADSDLPTRFADAAATAPLFGPFMVQLASLCRQWPSPETALGALRAQGAAPILVVGGVNDPVAPYAGVEAVVNQLASATLISYQGSDHGGYLRSSCVQAAADSYLLDGTVPAGGTLCPS